MTNLVQLRIRHAALPAGCRVFDDDLLTRLATLNAAARSLRSMGYRLLDQRVKMGDGGKPVIQIGPGRETGTDAISRATAASSTYLLGNCTYRCVDFKGVRVIWKIR